MSSSATDPPDMDSSPAAGDEPPRFKFLCSFGGSILPRPVDGRLRYVGGETRIVSLPRDVSYDDLLSRMRELFDAAAAIKYQQPDEDLDALVSVVNDDDVMNMMEEYDKLGAAGDGFTRLRIFLFPASSSSQQELDPSISVSHFDADERETERRYIDALNSLADTTTKSSDTQDQFMDYGIPNHLSLHQLNIPRPSHGQRYGELEVPWSPAYFSPAHPRDIPPSPSSARYHLAAGEFGADEYVRQSPGNFLGQYDRQSPPYVDSMLWLPPGTVVQEKAGFPGNLGHAHSVFEGSSICDHCQMAFQRNTAPVTDPRFVDPRWKHGQPHIDQSNGGNIYNNQFPNSCSDCYHNREAYLMTPDVKLDHGVYVKEYNEHHRPFYNEAHVTDRGWPMHHHPVNHQPDDPRMHLPGTGRVSDHYVVDGSAINAPFTPGYFYEEHLVPSNCINHDDIRYPRPGTEFGNEVFHAQHTGGSSALSHIPGFEDTSMRYGNHPSAYVADNLYQVQQNLPPIQSLRRKVQVPGRPGLSYESPGLMMPNGGISASFIRSPQDVSPRLSRIGVESQTQNSFAGQNGGIPQKILGFDGSAAPEYVHDHALRMSQNIMGQDGRFSSAPDQAQCQPGMAHVEISPESVPLAPPVVDEKATVSFVFGYNHFPKMETEENSLAAESYEIPHGETTKLTDGQARSTSNEKQNLNFDANKLRSSDGECQTVNIEDSEVQGAKEHENNSGECLTFLPELIASVKKAALESVEVVKAKVEADADEIAPDKEKSSFHELEPGNAYVDLEADSDRDGENENNSKIEPTTAEAEALAKGLQTIRNDDLEEIRELGTGTYGAVYHAKWKGSDVAVKRIKASCFAGRPSERERLIADFWKEALILSSLHHPNVVSFYGVVRDGPDGGLATVTEFMINGSLKQFLKKKDRTIDRRKRLIIAMDAAFGMEYLHGKSIVHFDLKCENLLVNMRDPHRPICKIGDLGLSKVKQHTLVSGGVRGTLPWMAPELLSGKCSMVTEKIDVYSFGIVMWELLTGEEPYGDMRCASVIGGIVNNSLRPQIPTWCDPEWKSLMESCWSSNPDERPSFSEISQKLRKMAAAINVK